MVCTDQSRFLSRSDGTKSTSSLRDRVSACTAWAATGKSWEHATSGGVVAKVLITLPGRKQRHTLSRSRVASSASTSTCGARTCWTSTSTSPSVRSSRRPRCSGVTDHDRLCPRLAQALRPGGKLEDRCESLYLMVLQP